MADHVERVKALATEGRDDASLVELQVKKKELRDQLRNIRADMKRLDAELIANGASGADLVLMCW